MPITDNGQGYSAVTPYKQEGFAKMLAKISNIAYFGTKLVNKKRNWNIPTQFLYVDCNSGCGFSKETGKGSPVVAMEILSSGIQLTTDTDINYFDNLLFIFCDKSSDSLHQLFTYSQMHFAHLPIHFFEGDNNSEKFYLFVEQKRKQYLRGNKNYGLIYADPNGALDYPLDNINRFALTQSFSMTDIMINFNTGQLKRNRMAFKDDNEHQRRHLSSIVHAIEKKKIFVRRHYPDNNPFKFAHFFFTNYPNIGEYKSINLFDLEKKEGKEIFTELCYTKEELGIKHPTTNNKLQLNLL